MTEPTEGTQGEPQRKKRRLPPTRRFPVRLYASVETSEQVELAMIDVAHHTRFQVSKAEVSDALCAVGARYVEEVAEYIKSQRMAEDA